MEACPERFQGGSWLSHEANCRGGDPRPQEQFTLFVYIAFATFIFLIPAALVSAELSGAFGERGGGVCTWVKEVFGARWGFVAIWLPWI